MYRFPLTTAKFPHSAITVFSLSKLFYIDSILILRISFDDISNPCYIKGVMWNLFSYVQTLLYGPKNKLPYSVSFRQLLSVTTYKNTSNTPTRSRRLLPKFISDSSSHTQEYFGRFFALVT